MTTPSFSNKFSDSTLPSIVRWAIYQQTRLSLHVAYYCSRLPKGLSYREFELSGVENKYLERRKKQCLMFF